MKNDARKYTTEEKHLLRKIAVQRVLNGEVAAEVGRSYGLGARTIYKWLRMAREHGLEGLSPKARSGRNRMLSELEEEEVKRWVIGGDPRQHGFDFGLWTRQIISELILKEFDIEMSITSVGKLLHRLGLTPQKPVRRAYERDDEEVQHWREKVYPKIRQEAKKLGAEIFWLDEAAIRSDDPLLRTWGLKGQTPNVRTSGHRQKVNAISAISNSGGFWYHLHTGKFNADVFIECLQDLIKNRRRPIFIITDGHPVHKSKNVKDFLAGQKDRIRLHILPPYAPDLNADELVWNYIRNTGTARNPLKKGESLLERTIIDMELIRSDPDLVKSFFKESNVSFASH